MNLFERKVPEQQLCEIYRRVEAGATSGDLELLQQWCAGFEDRDGKFVHEFQTTFNSSFWELYLHAVLKEFRLEVDYRHARPDFVVTSPHDFCIEAVTAQPVGGKPLEPGQTDETMALLGDLNELNQRAMVRLANSFHSKVKKYRNSYSTLAHVRDKPFVLAVAAFDSPAFFALSTRPMEALLYNYYVDEEAFIAGEKDSLEGEHLASVNKDNGAPIELGMFQGPAFAEVSAVVWNPCATWGKVRTMSPLAANERVVVQSVRYNPNSHLPHHVVEAKPDTSETLLDGLTVFHNPFAKHPLDPAVFGHPDVAQMYADYSIDEFVIDRREGQLLFRSLQTIKTRSS
jgi:hypothetical protein